VVNKYELAHPFHNNHNNNNNKLANNAVNAANINVLVLSVNNELPNNGVVVNVVVNNGVVVINNGVVTEFS
jgi:hypothetical protein